MNIFTLVKNESIIAVFNGYTDGMTEQSMILYQENWGFIGTVDIDCKGWTDLEISINLTTESERYKDKLKRAISRFINTHVKHKIKYTVNVLDRVSDDGTRHYTYSIYQPTHAFNVKFFSPEDTRIIYTE